MVCRSRRRRCRSGMVLALSYLLALQAASPCWAWGRVGHGVIAKLAERHLTDRARAGIAELLESGESLADCSTWADEHRGRLPKSAPWHYVDCPLDEPRYDARFSGDDPNKGCIVDKIHEFKATLRDRSKPAEERRFALRFLVHLVEDLHMPLHVGENHDKCGNRLQVRFFDRGTNLHSVWDSGIISHAEPKEDRWLDALIAIDTEEARGKAQTGTVEDWATESLVAARQAYQDPATGRRMKPGAKLGGAYQEANLPMAKRRLYQAGARLAMVLNEVFRND